MNGFGVVQDELKSAGLTNPPLLQQVQDERKSRFRRGGLEWPVQDERMERRPVQDELKSGGLTNPLILNLLQEGRISKAAAPPTAAAPLLF